MRFNLIQILCCFQIDPVMLTNLLHKRRRHLHRLLKLFLVDQLLDVNSIWIVGGFFLLLVIIITTLLEIVIE